MENFQQSSDLPEDASNRLPNISPPGSSQECLTRVNVDDTLSLSQMSGAHESDLDESDLDEDEESATDSQARLSYLNGLLNSTDDNNQTEDMYSNDDKIVGGSYEIGASEEYDAQKKDAEKREDRAFRKTLNILLAMDRLITSVESAGGRKPTGYNRVMKKAKLALDEESSKRIEAENDLYLLHEKDWEEHSILIPNE
jgi:hypothetical protein